MWWELDADKEESTGGALLRTVKEALGQLEWKENELAYPGSSESFYRLPVMGNVCGMG